MITAIRKHRPALYAALVTGALVMASCSQYTVTK